MDLGVPVTLIAEAVLARTLSALKDERVRASNILKGPESGVKTTLNKENFVSFLKDALYAAKIISYTQGYMLLRQAAKEQNWNLNYASIALMWKGGCIIRR